MQARDNEDEDDDDGGTGSDEDNGATGSAVVMMCQSPPKLTTFSLPPEIWGIKEGYCRKERLHQSDKKRYNKNKNGRKT